MTGPSAGQLRLRGSAMPIRSVFPLCVVAFSLAGAIEVLADDAEDAEEAEDIDVTPVRCISMGRIRTTTVVDDRNILFYRRGGPIYHNILEQNCRGLKRSGLFTYKVQSGARHVRLCDTDTINVIEAPGSAGFNCALGQFFPISELRAEELLNPDAAVRLEKAIEVEPVELPDEGAADKAE